VTNDMKLLEQRVAALESGLASATREVERMHAEHRRAIRRNGFAASGLLACVGAMLLGAAPRILPVESQKPQPLTVRAPFKVVDEKGREVAAVDAHGTIGRGLSIFSDVNQIAFMGESDTKFGGLQVWHEDGTRIAMLGDEAAAAERPGLRVFNRGSREVALVTISDDQGGAILATSEDGSEQAQLKIKRDLAGFWFYQAGKLVLKLGRAEKQNIALTMNNGDDVVAGLGESVDGSGGSLLLNDPSGELRVRAGIARGQGGQVVVYGAGGEGSGQAGIATKGSVGSVFAGPIEEPVAKMGQSENTSGAGHLALAAPGGGMAMQAGYQKNMGLVVTYAEGKPAGILSPGLKIPGFTAGANW
jgi:hypothetical protein